MTLSLPPAGVMNYQQPIQHSRLRPENAHLIWHNDAWLKQLAIPAALFTTPEGSGVWGGESLLPGMSPLAQVYSGHQFGVWAGQLGDGRGILLGEQQLADGSTLDWHLKGAGLTPYSRMGMGAPCCVQPFAKARQRGDALSGNTHHAGIVDCHQRHAGISRNGRAWGDAHSRGAKPYALWPF